MVGIEITMLGEGVYHSAELELAEMCVKHFKGTRQVWKISEC